MRPQWIVSTAVVLAATVLLPPVPAAADDQTTDGLSLHRSQVPSTVTAAPDLPTSVAALASQPASELGSVVPPVTLTVYATRIGLVGNRTASGHIVAERDDFVALPSRRALGHTVNLCNWRTNVCHNSVVRDVGPWNIRDDYWNPLTTRQEWRDLPAGLPQAQAARESGHNGGLDGFGRSVVSPAGIDLADGTFWDHLGMSDNDWISVTYPWTGGVTAQVATDGSSLNVRTGAGTGYSVQHELLGHQLTLLNCVTTGDVVNGTNVWYRISGGGYVTAAFVNSAGVSPPAC